MENNKLETISNLFEDNEIRSVWDSEKEEYYFSVVDVIAALTGSSIPRNYWSDLKRKLRQERSQLHENIVQLKMKATDGKMRETDTLDTKGILRLIESIPSPKAEPFKLWLAKMGNDRIDEIFDPEIALNRAIDYYRNRGYSDKWIEARLKGILDRKKLTDVWKENGIKQNYEYAILTNEIYQSWSGMKASEYKDYKNIRKESLRDNMTDIEVALTDLGEIATRELAKEHRPYGLKANRKIAKMGGHTAKVAREDLEKNLGKTVISNSNALNYKYLETDNLDSNKRLREGKTVNYSYVMGIDNIDKLQENNFEIKSYGNNYGISFSSDKIEMFENFIFETLQNGFWNEYLGKEKVFIFKFNDGKIKRYVLNKENEKEVLNLCQEFADCKFESIDKMLRDNDFYAETYFKN